MASPFMEAVKEVWIIFRELTIELLLKKLMLFQRHLREELGMSNRSSTEIFKAVESEVQSDLQEINVLIGIYCEKCLARLPQMRAFSDFMVLYLKSRNGKVQKLCHKILEIVISEGNAQQSFSVIYEIIRAKTEESPPGTKQNSRVIMGDINSLAYCNALKQCIDKGASPAVNDIKSLLTLRTFKTGEALLPNLQMMEQLIKAYRDHGNTDPIEIYLNPMQDLYEVSEDLRLAAGRVIREAYLTLTNCLKSGSLIDTLLFLDAGVNDGEDVAMCELMETADGLLERDRIDGLSMDWIEKRMDDRSSKCELIEKLQHRNDNFLQRSVLHLFAVFLHDEQVLKHIPKEFIEKWKNDRDLHGCTPLHISYLHGNQSLASLLESYQAKTITDHFGRTPESFADPYEYCEDDYTKFCQKLVNTKSSVYDNMKELLVLPLEECNAIADNFEVLFRRMVAQDGFLNATVRIAGSVREKLKVGRFNEVDLQICMDSLPFLGPFADFRFNEYLIKRLTEIEWDQILLRPVSVAIPWKFIWERKGCFHGLPILVDVVPIVIDNTHRKYQIKTHELFINNASAYKQLEHLKFDFKEVKFRAFRPQPTFCMEEWDILDNLPPGCRLGILIVKAFLEALDQVSDPTDHGFVKAPITSYVVKNALFYILAGKTPEEIEKERGNVIGNNFGFHQLHGSFIGKILGFHKQQFDIKETSPTWMTDEDLEKYGEHGRFWAETIFRAICFMARNFELTFGSFLQDFTSRLSPNYVYEVSDTCDRCIELLRPSVFFRQKRPFDKLF